MRITYNINFIDIYVRSFARIYSTIFLKTRVILNNYSIPAFINTNIEIYLILRKIIDKISVIYTLNRIIAITNASKKITYIKGIYNSQEVIYRKIKVNISFIIININTHDVILGILYILVTRINIHIKKSFKRFR